jgi:hypothetical protein
MSNYILLDLSVGGIDEQLYFVRFVCGWYR